MFLNLPQEGFKSDIWDDRSLKGLIHLTWHYFPKMISLTVCVLKSHNSIGVAWRGSCGFRKGEAHRFIDEGFPFPSGTASFQFRRLTEIKRSIFLIPFTVHCSDACEDVLTQSPMIAGVVLVIKPHYQSRNAPNRHQQQRRLWFEMPVLIRTGQKTSCLEKRGKTPGKIAQILLDEGIGNR